MEISEKPKRTRKPKDTAFDEEKAKLKKTLKKKVLKDDEEPLEFDLPETITNVLNPSSGPLHLDSKPTTQTKEQPKSEPINIPKLIITQTPQTITNVLNSSSGPLHLNSKPFLDSTPTPQNSYKTPVRNFILHSEYIY